MVAGLLDRGNCQDIHKMEVGSIPAPVAFKASSYLVALTRSWSVASPFATKEIGPVYTGSNGKSHL